MRDGDIERCGAKPPKAERKYIGQSCVMSKGHKSKTHRSLNQSTWDNQEKETP